MQVDITSFKANRVFRFCAWWSLFVTAVIVTLMVFPKLNGDSLGFPELFLSVFIAIVGMLGAVTSLILIAGMFIHLVKVSRWPTASKLLWIFLFIGLPPVSEAIYYVVAYRRRQAAAK